MSQQKEKKPVVSDDEEWSDLGKINLNETLSKIIEKNENLSQEFKTRVDSLFINCQIENVNISRELLQKSVFIELEKLLNSNNLDNLVSIGYLILAVSSYQCEKIEGSQLVCAFQNSMTESRLMEKKEKKLQVEKEETKTILKALQVENITLKENVEAKTTELSNLSKYYRILKNLCILLKQLFHEKI